MNVTASGNQALGGGGGSQAGSGLGAVLFNLNGAVDVRFSTLAGNTVANGAGGEAAPLPARGALYSLAYGQRPKDDTASQASLTVEGSIVSGTTGITLSLIHISEPTRPY